GTPTDVGESARAARPGREGMIELTLRWAPCGGGGPVDALGATALSDDVPDVALTFASLEEDVRRIGGRLEVVSRPGEGVGVRIRLSPSIADASACESAVTGRRQTILLVDDDDAVRAVAAEVLEME